MTELARFIAARDALQAQSHDYSQAMAGFHRMAVKRPRAAEGVMTG